MKNILELNKVCFSYHSPDGETEALKDLSFSVKEGEFVAVVGPSGCGKSTLLSLICGLIKPESGTISIKEGTVGYMLQKDHLFEWRTIFDNAALGLEIRRQKTEETKGQVLSMLKAYGLDGFQNAYPRELSGGMRQRAALIRTLALKPDILLLDEPFSALDYQTRLEVCDDIATILKKEKKTAVLVTHDLSEAISVGERIFILSRRPGRLKKVLPLTFTQPELSPLERRNTPEFSGYFNAVWKELKDDE